MHTWEDLCRTGKTSRAKFCIPDRAFHSAWNDIINPFNFHYVTLQCECIVDLELITIIRCFWFFSRFLLLQIPTLHPCSALFLAPWSCFPSLPFTFLPWSSFPLLSLAWRFVPRCLSSSTSKNQPECRSQTQPLWSRRRSLLCFQLTGSGGFCKKTDDILTDAEPPSSAFLLQLNFELEMDSYSELQLQKDRPDCEGSLLLNTEVEENLSSPFISDMDLQEEDWMTVLYCKQKSQPQNSRI